MIAKLAARPNAGFKKFDKFKFLLVGHMFFRFKFAFACVRKNRRNNVSESQMGFPSSFSTNLVLCFLILPLRHYLSIDYIFFKRFKSKLLIRGF